MKRFLYLSLLLLIAISMLNAQVRRIVLLEEATNASCPDCYKSNIKLQDFFRTHFGGVISVRYHASWPGSDDPMYLLAKEENDRRIHDYYGIFFVADYFLDGLDYGEPLDSQIMIDQVNHHLFKDAPVKIMITANIDADSVRAALKLIGISPVSRTQLKLRAAVIERMVKFTSPPGSNGEKVFPDVMRKMLPDTSGFAVGSINPGNEFTYYVSCPVNPKWNWQDLAVVAWLQTDENRAPGFWQTTDQEVIQSNISIPNYVIKSDDPLSEFLSLNQHVSKKLKIINDNATDLHIRLKVTEAQVPSGWSYNFTYNNLRFDTTDIKIIPGDSAVFNLNINTGMDPGTIKLALFAQNLDDPYGYGYTADYLGITKSQNCNVLFINDDEGKESGTCYRNTFDSLNISFAIIEGRQMPSLIDQITKKNFKTVFWNMGKRSRIISRLDMELFKNYLRAGGNLFLSVSESNFYLGLNRKMADDLFHNYLDAAYYGYFSGPSLLVGIEGTLGAGISTNLSGSNREAIGSYSGVSDTIFQYTGNTSYLNFGGISYDAGLYKLVFMGVGLNQFVSVSDRKSFVQNVVKWFDTPSAIANEKPGIPAQFNLEQNYPNPFNPATVISYQLPVVSYVTLKIYDVLGKQIKTLINEEKPAGRYRVRWSAENLVSGVYFYQINAGNYIKTKKMILLR